MAELIRQAPIEYELLKNNRFEMIFPSDIGLESVWLKSAGKPKIKVNSIELPYMNTVYFVPGKVQWSPIDIEMIATIGPSSSQKLMEWVRLMYEALTGRMGYAKGYMKDLELNSLDPTGVNVESWKLRKCFVTDADFGSLDMGNDDVQTIKFTIQPQDCIQLF